MSQAFQTKQMLMPEGNLFDIFYTDLTQREREALEFLYAYMPLADITDYPGSFHLMNVRSSFRALEEMPWGRLVPEVEFRHFVLPVRVNNEHLDSSRVVFYEELKSRVEGLSMYDAILEVNHWCHEKAVYQPSDARTSSPLATVRTAYGRCGEESTFLVAALRSVGIPARQVYTPRWVHTDDNHAWVEAWADGKWYFLGACEPEPVLNLGWFNAPASRGILMHTKVFGHYTGGEEVVSSNSNYTEISITDNYAPVSEAEVQVVDRDGKPVSGALVEFKVYNYAELYTLIARHTDAGGRCFISGGRGDMLVWASTEDGWFGFSKLSLGKMDTCKVCLDRQVGDAFQVDIDLVPPVESSNLPEVTAEQRAENDRRMLQEDSIRLAYTATFMDESSAARFASSLQGLSQYEAEQVAGYLVAARGNHAALCDFLTRAVESERLSEAVSLLGAISAKDLRDARPEVLTDHLMHTPQIATQYYVRCLLNPRISTEDLTPYKSFFQERFNESEAEVFRTAPHKLVEWCRENIVLNGSLNMQRIPMSPEGVWTSRRADSRSLDIFFVAVARSLGIPAWIDEVTGKVRYQDLAGHPELKEGKIYDVDFGNGQSRQTMDMGWLSASFTPTKIYDDPKYYSHFTLSRNDGGIFRLQSYDEGSAAWSNLLKDARQVPAGYYLLTTGTRLASGAVMVHLSTFTVEKGQKTQTRLLMRESKDQVQVIGSFNSESLFTPIEGGQPAAAETSLLKACGRGYFVVGVLGVGQEPTNHALKDLAKRGDELEAWGRRLVLLFPDAEKYRAFRPEDFPGLPSTVIYGIDTHGIARQMAENLKLKPDGHLPLFVLADTFNRVVFTSQGYTIGLGDQLMRTVKGL